MHVYRERINADTADEDCKLKQFLEGNFGKMNQKL